ncbi:response regulator transcription factor [Litoribacter populi]|uniref:response regulator transcription factor n=1 Tax=Litoribacter populi TaxID=2598460 RepID=UPI00117DF9B5|nr:response regulator transcription factor [Litoribacter populi]
MNEPIKVLLAEDETALGIIIKESLESRNFAVDLYHDGEEVMKAYRAEVPDVLVLDVMMPKKDGFTLARDIRKENPNVPIIFLTAKSRTEDVVEGFGHGANDYLKKPFSMEELIVRIKALVKRPQQKPPIEEWLEIGTFKFHLTKQLLKHGTEEHPLTYREAQLLHALFLNKNELTDRSLILNKLWGSDDFFNARSMDVFITKLRKKLQKDSNIQILNIRGYGYKLVC